MPQSRFEFLNEGGSFSPVEQLTGLEFAATQPGSGGGNRFALPENSNWKLPTVQDLLNGVALSKEPIQGQDTAFVCIILENADRPGQFKKFPVGYFTDRLPVVDSEGKEAMMKGFDGNDTNLVRPIGGVALAWQQVPGEMVAYAAYRALAWAQKNKVDHFHVAKRLDVTTTGFNGAKSRQRVVHNMQCLTADGTAVAFSKENMPEVHPEERIKEAIDKLKKAAGQGDTAKEEESPF